jgi:glycosyltransferase involved in cell wall biosynthesis
MDATVAVATFGDRSWQEMAESRAVPSAMAQAPVIRVHGESLHEARNAALAAVYTEWIVYLDADDELEPGYIKAMATGTADVRGPVARYIRGRRERLWQPRVAGHEHNCTANCLPDGNWLLIGSAVRTDLLRRAGGWRDFPWSEDWDMWLRCWKAGGTFELIPDAIYRAHVRPDSRNRGATREARQAAHQAIHAANFPTAAAA